MSSRVSVNTPSCHGNLSSKESPVYRCHRKGLCHHPTGKSEQRRLERAVVSGELLRPMRGIYAETSWWEGLDPLKRHVTLARTLSQIHPRWVFCGATAAALLGFSPPFASLERIQVALPDLSRGRDTKSVAFHRLSGVEVALAQGVPVTSPARTAVDCMRTLPFAPGLAIADAATRNMGWDDLHLARVIESGEFGRIHGIARAGLVSLLADGRSESGGESIARANMVREGFALPDLQVPVPKPSGGFPYRVDFLWRQDDMAQSIYGELDGRIKYTDPAMLGGGDTLDALLAERRRESDLSLSCSRIVRFSGDEARDRAALAMRLDQFEVPRVCPPLVFTRDARHNRAQLRAYLQANASQSSSAGMRLDFLEGRDS